MIGAKLRQLRKQRNYSLRTLARLAGLSHSFICDIEHGRCNPSIENLQVLSNSLGVKPEIFLSSEVANNDRIKEDVSSIK
ncbi:MAG: helix-turn-helix domain-containing protein [Peptococcaceae bacterium]|nr:helix-turn-helix domain-containing protein [Peptococcaceae bacterium]